MKQWIASVLLFFVLLSGTLLHAQYNTNAFYTRIYKASDGLPDSYILNIYQDKKQYLWIGTYSGLSRFDGTSFTNFGIHNGFPDLYVSQFIEFGDRLWVGTRTSIGYFEKDRYITTEVNDGQIIDYVYGFAEVIPGKLWAFTSKGLYEWGNNKWVKKVYLAGFENVPYRKVLHINNKFYFCFNDRIIIKDSHGDTSMITTSSGRQPYFLSANEFRGRFLFHTVDGLYEFKDGKSYSLFSEQLKNKNIYYYYIDSKNRFWISTKEDGILVSESGNEQTLSDRIPLNITLVSKIFEDKGHNIWIANFQGLLKIKNSFFEIPALPGKSFTDHRFLPVLDTKGNFFVYDDKNGLVQYDGKQLHLKQFAHSGNYLQKDVHSSLIDAVAIDDEQNFWFATRARQLFKVDRNGNQRRIFMSDDANSPIDFATVCWDAVNKKIYCGGSKLFIGQNDVFKEFRSVLTGLSIENITRLLALKNGDVLVNSQTSGLWLIKPDGSAYNQSARMIIPVDSRLYFAEDMNGKIWVSITGNGLKRLSYLNDSSLVSETDITTMSGLPSDVVETIAIDSKNRLWAATLSGLIVMDTLAGSSGNRFVMYNIGRDHGLDLSIHTGLTRMMADYDRNIWFSTTEKIVLFRSNDFEVLSNSPVTHIENIKLNMKETDWHQWSNTLDGYFMLPQNLELPHNQNTLTFSFKGINYNSDEKVWYSYKLIGVDTAWGPATESNAISFVKLTPGTFTFMVRTRNNNSPWGEPSSFIFTIRKPFWNTWWFRVIGILITSVILVLIFRVQLVRVRKRAALETQLRNLEMKALKAQMNPHFIYNALNSIQSLVIDDKKTDALDYMVKFSRLLRQVLNHSELNTVSLAKELDALKLYIQLESLRLNYSLNYSIKLDDNIIPEKEMVPPMILQPFVENALWHGLSKKEGNKVLYIYVRGEENNLRFDISDNGIGRARAAEMKKPDSYYEGPRGIDITKTRLSLYNLNASFEPLEVHDIINQDESAGGTIVTVRIRRQ